MSSSFSTKDARLMLAGPVGQLEAMTTWPEQGEPKGVAIICHPHPLHQGTMRNKVVAMLAKTMQQLDLATVRFNYRGVGQSEGSYGEMVGEIEDLQAVLAWVREQLPGLEVWLLGFSFGSFISASVANQDPHIKQLISVAPAVNHAEYQILTKISCPWLVIAAEEDEIVPFAEVQAFALQPPSPLTFVSLVGTSHFFHGKLIDLRETILKNKGLI